MIGISRRKGFCLPAVGDTELDIRAFLRNKLEAVKGPIRSFTGQFIFRSGLQALLLRDFIPVVAFHRISKTFQVDGGLTYNQRDFEAFCLFLARNFHVVPLSNILEILKKGGAFNRELAITFDDGYRNNYELAAPVLKTLELPATFFITTQFIGTDHVPWWDKKLGVRHEWMSWDQVRELHRIGFEIGSHTRTHADLGRVSKEKARNELICSRMDLEERLSAPITQFAYPYGGRENLTPDNRSLVEVCGYSCCCSCFGGLNTRGTDLFHLYRIPISNWYRSPHDFGFQLATRRI